MRLNCENHAWRCPEVPGRVYTVVPASGSRSSLLAPRFESELGPGGRPTGVVPRDGRDSRTSSAGQVDLQADAHRTRDSPPKHPDTLRTREQLSRLRSRANGCPTPCENRPSRPCHRRHEGQRRSVAHSVTNRAIGQDRDRSERLSAGVRPDVNRGVSSQIARLCTRAPTNRPWCDLRPRDGHLPTGSGTSPSAPVPAAAWPCYRVTGSTAGSVGVADSRPHDCKPTTPTRPTAARGW
jgi:hypothetical protein